MNDQMIIGFSLVFVPYLLVKLFLWWRRRGSAREGNITMTHERFSELINSQQVQLFKAGERIKQLEEEKARRGLNSDGP